MGISAKRNPARTAAATGTHNMEAETKAGEKCCEGGVQSGKIIISGSSSVFPVMEKLVEGYRQLCPEVIIELQQSDSSTGIANTLTKTCDIGMTSRSLTESEKQQGASERVMALDGIVVIVNKENPVNDLTAAMVRNIFSGRVTTWEEAVQRVD